MPYGHDYDPNNHGNNGGGGYIFVLVVLIMLGLTGLSLYINALVNAWAIKAVGGL